MAISHVDVPVGAIWYPAEAALTLTPPLWLASHGTEAHKEAASASWGKAQKSAGLSQASITCALKQWQIFYYRSRERTSTPSASRPAANNRYVLDITRARHTRSTHTTPTAPSACQYLLTSARPRRCYPHHS